MKIGSLFSGVGGLDMGVKRVFGGEVVWHSEIDPGACRVLQHRYPAVPNLGDITKIDWERVERPDVLCAGFPCQDVSCAGKQAGLGEGTRTGLWSHVARAADITRPPYIVLENVKGLLSARANRAMESTETTMGDSATEPLLRAIGAVCGDLGEIGYDAQYATLPASDFGAPHRRDRVFILATNRRWAAGPPVANKFLLSVIQSMHARHLLPTPRTNDGTGAMMHGKGGMDLKTALSKLPPNGWGVYEPAIKRWESMTRPAPRPTEQNSNGRPRMTTRFGEWMMGWPKGWVTDPEIGLSRSQQIKAIGNGVVPHQAAAALTYLLAVSELSPI